MTDPYSLRQCMGKKRYATEGEAQDGLQVTLHHPGYVPKPGFTLHVYQCRFCLRWHVGNTRIEIKTEA